MDERGSRLVSVPCGGMSGRTFAEAANIARLIAAAPKLLAALEEVFSDFGKVNSLAWTEKTAAAIAQAKGTAQ